MDNCQGMAHSDAIDLATVFDKTGSIIFFFKYNVILRYFGTLVAYLNSYTQNEGKKRGGGTNDPKIRIVTCIHIHSMRISCRGREKGGTGGGGG